MCEVCSHTRRVKVLPRDTDTHALPGPTTQSCHARSWVGRGSDVTNAFCLICILWQPLAGIEPRAIGPEVRRPNHSTTTTPRLGIVYSCFPALTNRLTVKTAAVNG